MNLRADNVSYTWRYRGGVRSAVNGVSAEFAPGTAHVICGPSGSGKSSLSYLLAGMLPPEQGTVLLNGHAVSEQRGEIAYVFQFPESIYFEDSVRAELEHWTGNDATLKTDYFAQLGIPFAAIAAKHPYHLSAGYGRLAAIALQLAREPKLLVLDEPTIGLDWDYHRRMVTLLRRWVNSEAHSGGGDARSGFDARPGRACVGDGGGSTGVVGGDGGTAGTAGVADGLWIGDGIKKPGEVIPGRFL